MDDKNNDNEVICEDCIHHNKCNVKEKQCEIYGVAQIKDENGKICIDFKEEY